MITPSINAQGLKEAIKELKELEPNVIKDLRTDLRSQLGGMAKQIASSVATAPLSGFNNNGATAWSISRGTVGFTPGKKGTSLASIRITPAGKKRGVYIAELAGSRSSGVTSQGRALIRNLNARKAMKGKGGRFAFDKFRTLRPEAVSIATKIVNDRVTKVNKKLAI